MIVDALLALVQFSTPVPFQYEKFYMPDALRIMDAIVETLQY